MERFKQLLSEIYRASALVEQSLVTESYRDYLIRTLWEEFPRECELLGLKDQRTTR